MIKKFDKNYVFVKMIYLNRQASEVGTISFAMKYILHAFSNKEKAKKYIAESTPATSCLGGQIITYEQALKDFGEQAIIDAIKINEAIENLNR